MAKKIYDIKPPKVAHKMEKDLKEFLNGGKKPIRKRVVKNNVVGRKKEKVSVWRPVLIGASIGVLVLCVYLFFKLPKAEITIWPKVETLSYQQTIIADKSVVSVDAAKGVIPAKYFESIKTNSQDFPATGSASDGGIASGTITVYNKYDPPSSFTFKAGTHFMSDSGKLFVALQKVIIPAAKKSGSKITPGSVQVKVQAVEMGTAYNIAPANFSIPGLKGTALYYSVYATSDKAMTGGYSGKVKKVNDDDIQGAKDVLTKKTVADATADLKSQISSDYVLLDNAVLSETTSAATQTKAGAIAESFNYQVTVKANALAFKKSDLDQFAKDYIISQLPVGKLLLDSSFKIDHSGGTIDVSGGKATLNLNFSSGSYQNIDKNSLTISILRENGSQINETIKNSLGENVSKVRVNFWPFWVNSVPSNQKAVTISLKFQ